MFVIKVTDLKYLTKFLVNPISRLVIQPIVASTSFVGVYLNSNRVGGSHIQFEKAKV
jgi:hypothetical protein